MAMKLLKERVGFKYKVGQCVYDSLSGENVIIKVKRWENGHRCYRLDSGQIRHERFLKA